MHGLHQALENIINCKDKSSSSNGRSNAADGEAIRRTTDSWAFSCVVYLEFFGHTGTYIYSIIESH